MKISATSALTESPPVYSVLSATTAVYRRAEKLLMVYFLFTAVMISAGTGVTWRSVLSWMVPVAVWAAVAAQVRFSRGWSRVTRDWAALGLLLVAYRQIDWFAVKAPLVGWQQRWVEYDRWLLDGFGLRAAIESLGPVIPSGLEAVYLCLYGIPPLCLGALYWYGRRDRVDRFLTTLFLGTFTAYALLPLFPVIGPRVVFPAEDLPHYTSLYRSINVWLLDRCDIASSVFPSGHVAVAFSSAFGLIRAIPERRWLCAAMLMAAAGVFIATIYCRYHYTADGVASIGITVVAWLSAEALDRNG